MRVSLTKLGKESKALTLRVGDGEINYRYRPYAYTFGAQEALAAGPEAKNPTAETLESRKIFCDLVCEWDLAVNDDPDSPTVPLTPEGLVEHAVPGKVVGDIIRQIHQDMRPSPPRPSGSDDSLV